MTWRCSDLGMLQPLSILLKPEKKTYTPNEAESSAFFCQFFPEQPSVTCTRGCLTNTQEHRPDAAPHCASGCGGGKAACWVSGWGRGEGRVRAAEGEDQGDTPQAVGREWTTGPGVLSGGGGDGADAGWRAGVTRAPRLWLLRSGNAVDGVVGGAGPRCAGRGCGVWGGAVVCGAGRVQERLCMRSWSSASRCKLRLALRPSQSGQQIKHERVDQVWTRCGGSRSEPPPLLCDAEKRGRRPRLRTVCPSRLRPVRHFGGHRGLYWREILLFPHSDMLSTLHPRPQPHARSHEPVPAFLSTTRPQREPVGG